jgi:ribosomal protein L7/L12
MSTEEDVLDHGRRIAELERKVSDLYKRLDQAEPGEGFGMTFASELPASADAAADAELLALVASGDKIRAIKRYRELTGTGLKEAKDAVERLDGS